MLVEFISPSTARFVMFGDAASQLLGLMGCTGSIPGAISAEDVPGALDALQTAVRSDQELQHTTPVDPDDESAVPLSVRAQPLVRMLEAAVRDQQYVAWTAKD